MVATGSSTYGWFGYYGDYQAFNAIDGQLSPGNSGFFHSNYEAYPWLKIEITDAAGALSAKTINRVQIYQRCDANEIYHQTSFVVLGAKDVGGVIPTPRLQLNGANGLACGQTTQWFFTGGTNFAVVCAAPIAAIKEVWIQKMTLHSHGAGWPGFAGGRWNTYTGSAPAQNANVPAAFLMINHVVIY